MFETGREIPRAVAGPLARDRDYEDRGAEWLLRMSRELGGEPLLYVPGRQNIDRSAPVIHELAQRVKTETYRSLPRSRWSGGPVLAAWPDRTKLAEIDGDRRTSALCVLVWGDGRNEEAWVAARQPEQLSPGVAVAPAASITDPVIEEGLKELTGLVNQSNNLAGGADRADAIVVLRTLHEGGHRLVPDEIYAYALAAGWLGPGADRLMELVAKISSGVQARERGYQTDPRPERLQVWRAART